MMLDLEVPTTKGNIRGGVVQMADVRVKDSVIVWRGLHDASNLGWHKGTDDPQEPFQ